MWTFTLPLRLVQKFVLLCLAVSKVAECHSINWGIRSHQHALRVMRAHNQDEFKFDNGAAQLLIEAFTDQLIRDMTNEPRVDRLTMQQAQYLKDRLKGLYAFLKNHPALMDRRLKVGSRKPQIATKDQNIPQKRNFENALSEPVCPSRTEWRLLRSARDINDTDVEIFQPPEGSEGHQWFYTVTCDVEHEIMENPDCPSCCRGIHRTSHDWTLYLIAVWWFTCFRDPESYTSGSLRVPVGAPKLDRSKGRGLANILVPMYDKEIVRNGVGTSTWRYVLRLELDPS